MGWPTSVKLTTIKPSGTLSLLPGVTPGAHPAFAHHLLRRIRLASNSPLVEVVRRHGYKVEAQINFDGTEDPTTVVAEFPMHYPEHTPTADSMSAIDQLKIVKRLQTDWSDNAVSCTIYFRPEELPEIKAYLAKEYSSSFKSLSFLRSSDHGFRQAPLERISRDEYHNLTSTTRIIQSVESKVEFESQEECEKGFCPIK